MSGNIKSPSEKAHDQALRLLSVRSRSYRELEGRLRQKGYSAEVITPLLQRLSEVGLLDDRRFAEERVRVLGKGKGWGPRKLRADLMRRGVSSDITQQAVLEAYGEQSPEEVMLELVCRRFGNEALTTTVDPKERSKIQRFLLGRGFEPDSVFALFSKPMNPDDY